MAIFALAVTFSVFALCILYKVFSTLGKREHFLPPGPPTVPVLGNLLSFPTAHPWYKFTDMARLYGDVYSWKILSGTIVVLSSVSAVRQILVENSGIVSDRPVSYIADEATFGRNFGFMQYGDKWRRHRRCAQGVLNAKSCLKHLEIQHAEGTQLMYDILTKPQNCYNAIQRFTVSVILSILYGHRTPQLTTPEVVDFFETVHLVIELLEPGSCPPIDLLPILKWVPERWAPWKSKVKLIRQLHTKLYFGLLEKFELRLEQGTSIPCFMESFVKRASGIGLDRNDVGDLGATLIAAGADTTASFLQSLVLALVNFPEIQRSAQEEIDRVVGDERAPVVDDIERLPYIQAVIKETMRWRPVAPIAIPHASIQDVYYKDYIIPKGSTIIQNTWGIFHDPEVFKDPSVFNPTRWLTDHACDSTYDLIFGSTRRICPGIHLAKNSLNISTMNLIWGFNFSKSKDPLTGQEKVYDLFDFVRGFVTNPSRFECESEPRSAHRADLIKKNYLEASEVFEPFEVDLNTEDKAFVMNTREEIRKALYL